MDDVDFAFKYPFSKEAKELIAGLNINHIDPLYISTAKAQIKEMLKGLNSRNNGEEHTNAEFHNINYKKSKIDYIISYVYSRMIISATPSLIPKYAEAVAGRSAAAMELDSSYNITKLSNELNIRIKEYKDEFNIYYIDYINNAPREDEYAMVNFNVSKGYVELNKHQAIAVLKEVIRNIIERELPIKSNIPKEVLDESKSIKVMNINTHNGNGREYGWIERLLNVPIPDCRHRTVNLILAPYLINIKNVDVSNAVSKIEQYIELCKRVNPDTKINAHYIRYQCEYAKKHGSKPLSLRRARSELSAIDFNLIAGYEDTDKDNKKIYEQ